MIPYAILAGKLIDKFTGAEAMDIRILDLAPDHFTYRVPFSFDVNSVGKIILFFFQYEQQEYCQVNLSDYEMNMLESGRFYKIYRVDVKNSQESYRQSVGKLSREYMAYMENKLYATDVELMSSMTSYPADQEDLFAMEEKSQIREWLRDADFTSDHNVIQDISCSILIDNNAKISEYLSVPFQEYSRLYWKEFGLKEDLFEKTEGIHIGNSFCIHLLPKEDILYQMLEKAKKEKVKITFLLPPVNQSQYGDIVEYLKKLYRFSVKKCMELTVEVNDYGLLTLLENDWWKNFHLSKGIFLHKHTKESRNHYRKKNSRIDKMQNYDWSDHSLYLPLYQMNTGTFCPVCGMIDQGRRDIMQRVGQCHQECMSSNFRYPAHLKMIGKYNSIFGVNRQLLCERKMTEHICKEYNLSWMVINL